MAKIRKDKGKELPAISTSSLPDIVFMLLFFFMVATKMREQELLVDVKPPSASQLEKLQEKSLNENIYIGDPKDTDRYGSEPVIQVNDVIITAEQIPTYIEQTRAEYSEGDKNKITWSLKIDREAKMGIVTDVKLNLRKVNARKINYSASKGMMPRQI